MSRFLEQKVKADRRAAESVSSFSIDRQPERGDAGDRDWRSHSNNRNMNLERGRVWLHEIQTVISHCRLTAVMRSGHAHASAFTLHLLAAGMLCCCHLRSRHRARHRRSEQRQQNQKSCSSTIESMHPLPDYAGISEITTEAPPSSRCFQEFNSN